LPRIFELDPHVADLIAAGEVVERPASVVKELMENAIDAGAGIITVEITSGGMTYIRVTDNGCGIAPEDAPTAFLRHATSKLRDAGGLDAIGTLGFRGEALAAISAVSRIELLTRESGSGEGVSVSLEAGTITDISPAGCPEGTTIIVRDLFFNTPARLKFMRSDRAESSAIASAVLRSALSRPEVSVRFIRDGKTEYHTPGDSRIDSCVYSLFGREFSADLLKVEADDDTIAVTGFVSPPAAARGNRSYQFFFINGRPIRSITLQAALERAFESTLPSGRFPSCTLYITTKPCNVDVNVHPAKTEVKFVSDKQVFNGVYFAVLGAIEDMRSSANLESAGNSEFGIRNSESTGSSEFGVRNSEFAGNSEFGVRNSEPTGNSEFGVRNSEPTGNSEFGVRNSEPTGNSEFSLGNSGLTGTGGLPLHLRQGGDGYKTMQVNEYQRKYGSDGANALDPAEREPFRTQHMTPGTSHSATKTQNSEFRIPNSEFTKDRFRVIGEALNTYIIVEYQNSVWFIDKHAAHERIHFNALKDEGFEPMSQALIVPVVCRHGNEDASLLLENSELLDKLGFTVESFGADAIAVRRIPAEIDLGDAEPVLSEICAQLRNGGAAEPARRDSILRTIACKAAIKAGRASNIRELEALAERVMSGEISQCPHGRPVTYEITKATLDKGLRRS